MKSLSALSGETIGLVILVGLQNVTLHEIPSTYEFKIIDKNRIADKLHAGATGKLLFSQLNNKELKIALANMTLEPVTEYTVTRKDQLVAQIKQIKDQGYGVSFGDRILEAMNISVPINNYVFPASANMLGPETRIKSSMNEYVPALKSAGIHIQKTDFQITEIVRQAFLKYLDRLLRLTRISTSINHLNENENLEVLASFF
jgi:DNA-binding IclR family transcriptional regulator